MSCSSSVITCSSSGEGGGGGGEGEGGGGEAGGGEGECNTGPRRRGPRGYWPLDELDEWPFQRIVPHLQLYHTCKLHHTWRSRRRESNKSTIHTDAITRGEYSHPRGNHIRGRGYDMSAFPPRVELFHHRRIGGEVVLGGGDDVVHERAGC